MVLTGWKLRKIKRKNTTERLIEDLESAYGRRYFDGHVDIFDMVDINLPLTSLDEGLYALSCEEDVRCLATLVRSFKLIEVYIEHGVTVVDSYQRPPPWVRATIKDITEPGSSAAIELRFEKMFLLTWHDSSALTKEPVCDSDTPRSLPQHDSSTPCKDYVIDDVMRQLSFEETELDGEAGFGDVARSGVDISGLSHDESFRVDDLDLNLNEPVDLNVSQTKTQSKFLMSKEDVEHGNGQEDKSASSDVQFFYDVEGIDSAYETKYDVHSSKDAGTYDDDDFLVDKENEIVECDVDVHFFGISMDIPFDNISVTNLVPDDVLEGEDMLSTSMVLIETLVLTMKQVITGGES
ncbi:hypothetical protein Tco_1199628 [Tanacetum coccineum]